MHGINVEEYRELLYNRAPFMVKSTSENQMLDSDWFKNTNCDQFNFLFQA